MVNFPLLLKQQGNLIDHPTLHEKQKNRMFFISTPCLIRLQAGVARPPNICNLMFLEHFDKEGLKMLYYTTFPTLFCNIILVGNNSGIRNLHLDTGEGKRQFCISKDWQRDDLLFSDAKEQIEAYCRGDLKQFTVPLTLEGTAFQKKVWRSLCEIPFGETRTYGELAENIGNKKGGRAVGNANSKNPIPLLVPCHRVIGANGTLTGFAHGLTIKQKLLEFETINVSSD